MIALLLTALLQWPPDHRLLAAEDARQSVEPLIEALGERPLQAIRALGRFERPELARHVRPFLRAESPDVRMEAANALAQMNGEYLLAGYLATEEDPGVRSALYEAIGRLDEAQEDIFVRGLGETEPARFGAAKGLESYLRTAELRPSPDAVAALNRAIHEASASTRRLILLSLLRAATPPRDVLERAFRDADAQVRRLAVMGLGELRDDPSYLVRYEALKAGFDCTHAENALRDSSPHVVLLAIDLLADPRCGPSRLKDIVETPTDWRKASHALVSLAQSAPEAARAHLSRFLAHPVWQARVYAARAAKHLNDAEALKTLRGDRHPNVVAAALVTEEEALSVLEENDYGLLVTALGMLEGWSGGKEAIPVYLDTLRRLTSEGRANSRDPRRLLLDRLRETGVRLPSGELDYLLADFDPVIAALAAEIAGAEPRTRVFEPAALPDAAYLARLAGARARITMKEAGSFVVALLPEVAPLTAAQFARLAEDGYYDGLTFHRIVPNFVLQGGSPGGNEFVGRPEYIRDEVSTLSHRRGTLGISTRGRDTGDSQIFINLVDNYRLDHGYTVFAYVLDGMENVDRILEGDVIEKVEISRGTHPGQALLELGGHAFP